MSRTRYVKRLIRSAKNQILDYEHQKLAMGILLSQQLRNGPRIHKLADAEFSVFSQWGDDGIIQWLVQNLDIPAKTFAEFGVEDFRESNTRFLMMKDNWSGLVMDGSPDNVSRITSAEYFWRYDLTAQAAFIDKDNINTLLRDGGISGEIGLLHIDLDGNDYWILDAIKGVNPIILILEYNSVFGGERAITVPYDAKFYRTAAHHSNLYFGASLSALSMLARERGYGFIGCNSAGNNAYYVRRDKLTDIVRECDFRGGYVESKFRDSRGKDGEFTYLRGKDRIAAIRGLPVYNVETGKIEPL
jgi:hypothetical protein